MMAIHTVAAGGGSILQFDGARYRVDQSQLGRIRDQLRTAGRSLTVTMQCDGGQVTASFFPKVFDGMEICHWTEVVRKLCSAGRGNWDNRTPEQVAAGFLAIAVEKWRVRSKKYPSSAATMFRNIPLRLLGGNTLV